MPGCSRLVKGQGQMLLLLAVLLSSLAPAQALTWVESSIIGKQFNYDLGQHFVMPTHQIAGVDVYVVDLFNTSASTVASMNAAGLVPICYFSTQYESGRPDSTSFPASGLGSYFNGSTSQRYVDIRRLEIQNIMAARIQLCKQKGFKAIDPGNTDCFGSCHSGFPLTANHALQYLRFLSDTARGMGLGVGLKNSLALINSSTVPTWDFAINEECYRYNECSKYAPFKNAGKPIFNVEYTSYHSVSHFHNSVCARVDSYGTVSILKAPALKSTPRDACALPLTHIPSSSPSPTPPAAASPNCTQQIAVPSYYYPCFTPGCVWQRTKGQAKLVVINPGSGPGTSANSDYVKLSADLRAAGTIVLGYVATTNAAKSIADVKAEVDKFFSWYNVGGILFDQASSACTTVSYYQQLTAYIKAKAPSGATSAPTVVLSWGTNSAAGAECFFTAAANAPDIVVNFVGTYASYQAWSGPAAWVARYPASRFWQMVYDVPATPEAFYKALTLSQARRAGWVYVTDDSDNPDWNPWDTLPSGSGLWDYEVNFVQCHSSLSHTASPSPSPSPRPPSPSPSPSPSPTPPAAASSDCTQQIAVPSYYYPCFTPGCVWQRTKGQAKLVVINPGSGPGTAANSDYVKLSADLRAAGTIVLGYVATTNAAKSMADVKAEVDKFFSWYNVGGILFDQASSACTTVSYYQQLTAYIKAKAPSGATSAPTVVLSWGTNSAAGAECFFTAAANAPDIVVNFVGTYASYQAWSGPAAWVARYPASKFWQMVYDVPATPEAFYKALTLSKARRAGWVYITDDSDNPDWNPWDTLPSGSGLWDLEVRLTSSTQQIAVPSYYYPCFTNTADCAWQHTSGNAATRLVIINPASGPGTAVDSNYVRIVNDMKAAGLIVLAYTHTTYGTRAAETVQADIDKFYSFYPSISGIFLDEGSTDCATLPYYQQVIAYTKTKAASAVTVLNWGMTGPECFLSAATNTPDIVVNFENYYSEYMSWSGPAAWTAAYPAHRFWHLVHSAPANTAAFGSALGLARARHAGWVYITSDVMENPWDTIPTVALWDNETAVVGATSSCI